MRNFLALVALFLTVTITSFSSPRSTALACQPDERFGVLIMAHGGSEEWNQGVLTTVEPLREQWPIEVAFGMADAVSIQEGVDRLEARGVDRIAVVRLFISGESWFERTEKILGIEPGAPDRPEPEHDGHEGHGGEHGGHGGGHGGHSMEFWRIDTNASFALTTEGLAEAEMASEILVERAGALSVDPAIEDVLILAHGPADDSENERWIEFIRERSQAMQNRFSFNRVEVMTLREDWPEKRTKAERRIRSYVESATSRGGRAIVIPFRVYGFGPYEETLKGLTYEADGQGLIPSPLVTEWISEQIKALKSGEFRKTLD